MIKPTSIPFAGLAQHPAHGFVHQIVRMMHQKGGKSIGIVELMLADKGKSRDDGDASLPKLGALGQAIKQRARPRKEVGSKDFPGRKVYEVPIIDVRGVGQIEVDDLSLLGFVGLRKTLFKKKKRAKTSLMPLGDQQLTGHI